MSIECKRCGGIDIPDQTGLSQRCQCNERDFPMTKPADSLKHPARFLSDDEMNARMWEVDKDYD